MADKVTPPTENVLQTRKAPKPKKDNKRKKPKIEELSSDENDSECFNSEDEDEMLEDEAEELFDPQKLQDIDDKLTALMQMVAALISKIEEADHEPKGKYYNRRY